MSTLAETARRDARIVNAQTELLDHSGHVRPGLAAGTVTRLVTEINELRQANGWPALDMTGRSAWVAPELRKLAEPDEYGRTMPFAVYVRYEPGRPEHVMRNYRLEDAEATADRLQAEHPNARIHVSLDACG